jgi:hypothetical protein
LGQPPPWPRVDPPEDRHPAAWQAAAEHEFWVLRIQCAMFPHALFCVVSRWAWCPLRCPPGWLMLDNLRIHQKFVAVLLLRLVLLAAVAAGRIRSNVTEGVRAGG